MALLDHADETVEDLFGDALWAHDLITWAARLEMAVTHGYGLATIERSGDAAGEILLDQLSGLPCGTAGDVRDRWPNLAGAYFDTDPIFTQVVAFVLDRANTLRTTAYDMAAIGADRGWTS